MSIPVPPSPNAPMTDSMGNPTPEWDKYFNTIQAVLNNTGGGILATNAGGTGVGSWTNGQLLIGNTTGNTAALATLTAGTNIAITNGASSITISFNGSLTPNVGGTGLSGPTAHSLLVTEGGSNMNLVGPLTNGQLLIGSTGADPVAAALTAGTAISTTTGAGSLTVSSTGITQVIKQVFSANGTYTPTAGMVYCIVEAVGGGGGGQGLSTKTSGLSTSANMGGGGTGAAYVKSLLTAAQIGSSQTVTIGSGGAGGAGANDGSGNFVVGSNGGDTSLGTLVIAKKGLGSGSSDGLAVTLTSGAITAGNTPFTGSSTGNLVVVPGGNPGIMIGNNAVSNAIMIQTSAGGNSQWGVGGLPICGGGASFPTSSNGNNGTGYGSGGSGAFLILNVNSAHNGGNGAGGYMIITEFLNV